MFLNGINVWVKRMHDKSIFCSILRELGLGVCIFNRRFRDKKRFVSRLVN